MLGAAGCGLEHYSSGGSCKSLKIDLAGFECMEYATGLDEIRSHPVRCDKCTGAAQLHWAAEEAKNRIPSSSGEVA